MEGMALGTDGDLAAVAACCCGTGRPTRTRVRWLSMKGQQGPVGTGRRTVPFSARPGFWRRVVWSTMRVEPVVGPAEFAGVFGRETGGPTLWPVVVPAVRFGLWLSRIHAEDRTTKYYERGVVELTLSWHKERTFSSRQLAPRLNTPRAQSSALA